VGDDSSSHCRSTIRSSFWPRVRKDVAGAPGRGLRGEPRTAPSAHRGSTVGQSRRPVGRAHDFRRLSREAAGATRAHELAAFNMDHPEKLARMEENLEFLRAVSRGGPVSFSGKYFAIDDFDLVPPSCSNRCPFGWQAILPLALRPHG